MNFWPNAQHSVLCTHCTPARHRQPGIMSSAALPPGWTLQTSRSTGKTYWFNVKTGESSYTAPQAPAPTQSHYHSGGEAPRAQLTGNGLAAHVVQPAPAPSLSASAAMTVASAYDSLTDMGIAGRRASSILHLKNFNNWIKSVLIAEYAPRPATRVLDLACGKLGDLAKWRQAGARTYCGIDISRVGIEDARGRFNSSPRRGGASEVAARLVRADLGATDLTAARVLGEAEQFDAISIQFALHYLFQSEARALTFFRNISGRLAPGGVFLGTIPDAAYLVRRLRDIMGGVATVATTDATSPAMAPDSSTMTSCQSSSAAYSTSASAPSSSPSSTFSTESGLTFGSDLYTVSFSKDGAERQWALGHSPYGVRYRFFLTESVDNVDEYLVPWQLLSCLAAAAGLVPLCADNFHSFYARTIGSPVHAQLARTMRVMNCEGGLTPAEWEAAGIYRVFAFQRPAADAAAVSTHVPAVPGGVIAGAPSAADELSSGSSSSCLGSGFPASDVLMGALVAAGERGVIGSGAGGATALGGRQGPVPYKLHVEPEDVIDLIERAG